MRIAPWSTKADSELPKFSEIVVSHEDVAQLRLLSREGKKPLEKDVASSLCRNLPAEPEMYKSDRNSYHTGDYIITVFGSRYLERIDDLATEKRKQDRWTRGLAVVAILISIIALALEFQDRGLLPFIGSAPKSVTQSQPDQ